MVVKSAVGGVFEIADIGVILMPGEVVDLSFYAKADKLTASKELRTAIRKGHLRLVDTPQLVPNNIHVLSSAAVREALFKSGSSIRRAVFERKALIAEVQSYDEYVMYSEPNRRLVVQKTHNLELLMEIIGDEPEQSIVVAAQDRLLYLGEDKGE